jgi:hypothetical protein
MKAEVVINEAGNVVAMAHPAVDSTDGMPFGSFRLHPGQRSAILEIPPELQHLKPHELHKSIRVDVKDGLPSRLVAR